MSKKLTKLCLVVALCLLTETTAPELKAADKSPPSPKKVVRTTPGSPKQAVLQAVAKGVGPVDPKKISGTKIPMIATTYSPSLHGRPTASGVTYNHRGYVVACRGGSPYRMGTRMAVMYGNRAVVVVRGIPEVCLMAPELVSLLTCRGQLRRHWDSNRGYTRSRA